MTFWKNHSDFGFLLLLLLLLLFGFWMFDDVFGFSFRCVGNDFRCFTHQKSHFFFFNQINFKFPVIFFLVKTCIHSIWQLFYYLVWIYFIFSQQNEKKIDRYCISNTGWILKYLLQYLIRLLYLFDQYDEIYPSTTTTTNL